MAIAETAKLVSSLELNTQKFDQGIRRAGGSLGKLSSSIAKSRAVAVGLGVGLERIAEKGISSLAGAIGDGVQGALELERTMNATQAVITSTGGAAGVTAKQINDMANAIEDATGVDDKIVQQGENLLLTFTNIGKTVFPQAAKAAVNMAVAFNKGDAATADIDKASIQLGKALNDPAKGFTALKKSGVSFSEAQIKILKGTDSLDKAQQKHFNTLLRTDKAAAKRYRATVLAANQLKSQKLILAELDKEFGKAGEAAQQGFAGDINRANDAIEEAKIAIAQGLIPALGEVARSLTTTLKDPKVMDGLKDLGRGIGDVITGAVKFAKTVPWGTIADSLRTAAGFAKDLLNAFLGLPSWIQTAVITGWGLNKLTGGALGDLVGSLASGLIKGVLGINAGVVNLKAATVVGGGGVGAAPTGAAGGGVVSKATSALGKVFLIGEAIGLVAAVNNVWSGVNQASSEQASAIQTQTTTWLAQQPSRSDLVNGLAAVDTGINAIRSNPLNVLVQGDALTKLDQMRTDITTKLREDTQKTKDVDSSVGQTKAAVAAAAAKGTSDSQANAARVTGHVDSSTGAIVGAINSIPQPIINISATTVQKTTVVADRAGPASGSRETSRRQFD